MKRLWIFLILILTAASQAPAQEVYVNPQDPAFRERYSSLDLTGRFSALAVSDETNHYYVVDFSTLPDRFSKVWFINLVFRGDKAVAIDADPQQDRVWFLAPKTTSGKVVSDYFLELKKKTETARSVMSEPERAEWLKKNDKYVKTDQ